MGRLGKDKSPLRGLVWFLCVVVLAGCAGRDGRYVGAVDADEGACGLAASGGRTNGALVVRGGEVIFAPDEGVLLLRGRIDAQGHVTASLQMPGVDRTPFTMVFEGDLRDGRVSGRYATPRCRASVRLDRVG